MNGLQDVGENGSDHEVDLLAFEQAFGLGHGAVGLEFVVDHDDLDILAAHLAAEILDRELKTVARLLAQHGGRSGERHDDADLDLLLRRSGCRGDPQHDGKSGQRVPLLHHIPPIGPSAENRCHAQYSDDSLF